MPRKLEDITGQKFDMLTVLGRATKEELKDVNIFGKNIYWKCKCDCGKITYRQKTSLVDKYRSSCGCHRIKERIELNQSRIGEKYGRLTIIGFHFDNGVTIYDCLCECGNITSNDYNSLTSGHKTSCGCYSEERMNNFHETRKKDLIGMVFGELTAIHPTNNRNTSGGVMWECKCSCGSIVEVSAHHLISGLIKSCGCINSNGERDIANILTENNINFKKQYWFSDLKSKGNKPYLFDFGILNDENKLLYVIEYDGKQHFEYNERGWNTEENFLKTREHDIIKTTYCLEHNIPIIRIPYTHYKQLCLDDLLLDKTFFRIKTMEDEVKIWNSLKKLN